MQGLAPAGALFPHFLSLLKENGQDRREGFIKSSRYPQKGGAPCHNNKRKLGELDFVFWNLFGYWKLVFVIYDEIDW